MHFFLSIFINFFRTRVWEKLKIVGPEERVRSLLSSGINLIPFFIFSIFANFEFECAISLFRRSKWFALINDNINSSVAPPFQGKDSTLKTVWLYLSLSMKQIVHVFTSIYCSYIVRSPEEVKRLIRALFQNSDRRAAVLARIKFEA